MNVVFNDHQADLAMAERVGVSSTRVFPTVSTTAMTCRLELPASVPAIGFGRILLVDDNETVRETLADLLDIDGFSVVQAADAAQAIAILRRDPQFDVLVTDLSMPGADGITLIGQARQIRADLPAILLTGFAEETTSVAVINGGNFHILRKPVDGDRLVQQITVLMKRPRKE